MNGIPLPLMLGLVSLLGLIAGGLGGLLGVGGSVIMIPGLVWLVGNPAGAAPGEQHAFQAAAMLANVAVAVPAMLRHRRAGTIDPAAVRGMVPAAAAGVLLGVMLSNLPAFSGARGGRLLARLLAALLVWVIAVNVYKLWQAWRPRPGAVDASDTDTEKNGPPARGGAAAARFAGVGGVMGVTAGLLGVGGGAIAVPLQQQFLGRPLRRAISNSATAMCVSAPLGALYKNLTLAEHLPADTDLVGGAGAGVVLGLMLAPAAWAGGRLGARLTHTLPLNLIRLGFVLLMVAAAWKLAGR